MTPEGVARWIRNTIPNAKNATTAISAALKRRRGDARDALTLSPVTGHSLKGSAAMSSLARKGHWPCCFGFVGRAWRAAASVAGSAYRTPAELF